MRRTNPEVEQQVLTQSVLGYSCPDISQKTGVPVSTIKKIRARNKIRSTVAQGEIEQWSVEQAKVTLQRTHQLLCSYLDEEMLGNRIRKMTITELLDIQESLFIQTQVEEITDSRQPILKKQQEINKLLSKLKKK